MSVDPKLLGVLRCPITKRSLKVVSNEDVARLNEMIDQGKLRHSDGTQVAGMLSGALITDNDQTLYKIVDDIPVMLEELSINADCLSD